MFSKRCSLLVILAITTLIVTACGAAPSLTVVVPTFTAQPTLAKPTQPPPTPTQEPSPTEVPPTPQPEPFKITWLTPSEWGDLSSIINDFEARNPDIKIQLQQVSAADLNTTIGQTLGASQSIPDVVILNSSDVIADGMNGWLEPLWVVFTFDQKVDWMLTPRQFGEYNHELYAAPISTKTQLLYYNADLMTQASVTPPGQGERWTWEQVVEAAKTLTKGDVWGFAWQSSDLESIFPLAASKGAKTLSTLSGSIEGDLNSAAWIDALKFYGSVFNEWKVSPQDEAFNPVESFEAGKLAMLIGPDADIIRFANANEGKGLDFNWAAAGYPSFADGKVVTPAGGWHIGVNRNSANMEAAKRLVYFLAASKGETNGALTLWMTGGTGLPAQTTNIYAALNWPAFAEPPMAFMKLAASEAMNNPVPAAITPVYAQIDTILQSTLADIRTGADPKQALDAAVQLVDQLLQ